MRRERRRIDFATLEWIMGFVRSPVAWRVTSRRQPIPYGCALNPSAVSRPLIGTETFRHHADPWLPPGEGVLAGPDGALASVAGRRGRRPCALAPLRADNGNRRRHQT